MIARKVMAGASVSSAVSILSPDHPDVEAMYSGNISGSTMFDDTPNGNDLTISGASTVPGIISVNALSFDGINDYARKTSGVPFFSTQTMCGWVKQSGIQTVNRIAFSVGQTHLLYRSSNASASSDGVVQNVEPGSNVNTTTNPTNPTADTWVFVLCMFTGTSIELYYDNVLIGSDAALNGRTDQGGSIYIGSGATNQSATPAAYFAGEIDRFRYINRAVSAEERSQFYTESPD